MKSIITKNQSGNYVLDISVPLNKGDFMSFIASDVNNAKALSATLESVILELREYVKFVESVKEAENEWNNRNK